MPSPAAVVVVPAASSVGAAAKSDVKIARAPETGELGVEFVSAFLLARSVLASWVYLKAILCSITKIKLNGSADVHAYVNQFN